MNRKVASPIRVCFVVAVATVALSACGPDDSVPANTQASSQPNSQANTAQSNAAPREINASAAPFNASMPFATQADKGRGSAQDATQDSAAILSAQASLSADNQQITPVLHYAPGDESH